MKRLFPILLLVFLAGCQLKEQIPVTQEETMPEWLPKPGGFEWTKAEDIESRALFLRNFGVGYSYNAVRGSFCDWKDIRCQIVNRRAIEDYQERNGEPLTGLSLATSTIAHSQFNYSKRDYIAAVHLETKEKVDLGLYNKEKRSRQDFLEDGLEETFYYSLDEEIILADRFISPASVLYFYEFEDECDNFLTLSFVNAVRHVADSDPTDIAVVDSLINIYGTHVITQSWLGGKIRVDLSNYMFRYKDTAKEDKWSSDEFLDAVSSKDSTRTGKDEYAWIEHGKLNISAYGGDQSSLTSLLGEHAPDGTRTFSTEGISQWRLSLFYDPDDEKRSNVEMVDMRLTPIWEFAEAVDYDAAQRIKAAILQDVSLQQSLLGENNFFDTKFPIRYPSVGVQYHDQNAWKSVTRTDSAELPMIVNIVSGGRYVASVCHENVNNHDLWVCYPIYEGKIKMPCGLGVDDSGRVYSVMWLNGLATTLRVDGKADDTFYINGGQVDIEPQEGVTYADAFAMPYLELSGGVKPDGGYEASPYMVTRDGADFVLYDCKKVPANMVGWGEDGHRLTEYVYIYNPNELRHE